MGILATLETQVRLALGKMMLLQAEEALRLFSLLRTVLGNVAVSFASIAFYSIRLVRIVILTFTNFRFH